MKKNNITAKQVLKWAKSQIGYKENPPGSNKTKYGKWYGLNGQPWCVIFIWAAFYVLGATHLFYGGKKTAFAPTLYDYMKKKKRIYKNGKKGDVVFFDWNRNGTPDHVGFLYKKVGATYYVIEGNTSLTSQDNGGKVMLRKRYRGNILGFGRPDYAKPKKTTKEKAKKKLPTLKKGSKGKYVKKLQKILKVKADGIFGTDTEKAVKKFQKKHGLEVDGIVGAKTWKALLKK